MAGQLVPTAGRVRDYGESVTFTVVVTCLMAASCGLILGYDSGISGAYSMIHNSSQWRDSMESFLSKFFPEVLRGTKKAKATVTNYFTNRIPVWGWRVSLGLAAVPSALIVVGTLFVSDTPSSLVLRGHPDRARTALQRIRGLDADIDAEFKDIVSAVNEARQNDKGAFRRLFNKEYRHYLAIGVAIPVFFEFTGMIVIDIFSPLLFRTVGFNSQKAILGSVFLALLCAMKYAVFLFYAGCLLVMTIFVTFTFQSLRRGRTNGKLSSPQVLDIDKAQRDSADVDGRSRELDERASCGRALNPHSPRPGRPSPTPSGSHRRGAAHGDPGDEARESDAGDVEIRCAAQLLLLLQLRQRLRLSVC
ncbi:hypothetical protein HU200_027463 [Digitaria exilis]|uniref:Uncharacterized protein n=1 Tax=Digitaria exilis TaxID=1010633 RepID=A0A835BW57_9POAL|nr:hypothetical protein HU200_027463 [Digitaria exilis]